MGSGQLVFRELYNNQNIGAVLLSPFFEEVSPIYIQEAFA